MSPETVVDSKGDCDGMDQTKDLMHLLADLL